jgi:hypothetical protein
VLAQKQAQTGLENKMNMKNQFEKTGGRYPIHSVSLKKRIEPTWLTEDFILPIRTASFLGQKCCGTKRVKAAPLCIKAFVASCICALAMLMAPSSFGGVLLSTNATVTTSYAVSGLLGSAVYNYQVNVALAGPQYVDGGGDAAQLTTTISSVCWISNPSGVPPSGTLAEIFGVNGIIGSDIQTPTPFTSSVSIAGPDTFAPGTYQDSVNTALSGSWPVSFTINLGLGSISISPPSVSQSPISLQAPPSGQNLIYIDDTVYAGALSGDTGFFGSGGSVGLNFNVTEGAGGTEVGTNFLTLPFQCFTELGSLGAVQDIGPGQTLTLAVEYIRGDHIPSPAANVSAGSYYLNVGQQTTLTVTVQNPSKVVSLSSGEVSIDISSLGNGLAVIGAAQENLGVVSPQGSATYVFTLQATVPGNFRPQVNLTGGFGSPVPSTKTFSVSGTPGANVVVPATITVQSSPSNGGIVTGGGNYSVGSTATLTASPSQYFNFTGWSDGNTQNPRSITVSGNATYTADFQQQTASIIVQANPGNGGTVSGSGIYPVGSQQQISASPANIWLFAGWSDGNTQNPRTITVPSGGATYTADFSQQQATITVVASPSTGGTANGGGTFAVGSQQQISANANSGWTFTAWSDGNNSNPRIITVPAGGTTYTALFQQQTATVTLSSSPSGAGILNGGGTYAVGSQVTIFATPNGGWSYYEWSDGQTQNPRVITVPAGGVSLTAIFTSNTPSYYTVSATSSPVGIGIITGGGSYAAGSSITMTATPTNCYQFSNWTVGGVLISQSSNYTFTVESNESLVANFVPMTYTVNTSVSPSRGGSATVGGIVDCGDSATVTATNNLGYQFVNWTENGIAVSAASSYTFVVQSNLALVANFVSLATNSITGNPGITNLAISGGPTTFTLSISGTNFYALGQSLPFTGTGTTTNMSVVDYYYLGSAERGYAGDATPLDYLIWTNSFVQVGDLIGNPGDAITVSMFPPSSPAGAVWAGNIPGGPAGIPEIDSVQVAGCLTNLIFTIYGKNFGPPPVPMPTNTNLNYFLMQDHRVHGMLEVGGRRWGHGSPDSIVPTFMSWTNNKIVLCVNGAAAGFQNGDPLTIVIWQSTDTSQTGLQTAWGGTLIQLPLLTVGSPAASSNGFNLVISGPTGLYEIQVADDLGGTWTTIGNVTNANGQVSFTDSNSGAHKHRYYQAIYNGQ